MLQFQEQLCCTLSVVPPIKTTEGEKALVGYPDQSIAKSLLDGLKFGLKLNNSGPRLPFDLPTQSEIVDVKVVTASNKIKKDISLGKIVGPFTSSPFRHFEYPQYL